ncbi:hypothetical protein [Desulforhabdus amnigena]|jgi:hypothetical protein|uniref:Magnetosome protein MamS/MamX domain-containing protein n=1 Tax=Desulforhabdus amnigena TaxID=40218 RepID=A0A9W6FUJ6_9BACT|nr:hypothetical protein [Desulforhabdus amnigena]NLJ29526.1 hypothetical protein [Deltaproteobacteria bacterium]GLI35156.1 hypothetical protein DAMNIGENAA_25890 [Desulforhabdus amnigena]
MRGFDRCVILTLVLFLVLGPIQAASSFGADKGDLTGWEKGSEYNRFYNSSEMDQFKGQVEEIVEVIPLPGMAPGVGLKVKDQDGDMVEVQLGPKSFVNVDSIGLKKGDKVKVKGVWADIGEKEVFMASKVKKSETVELKVRKTKDGTPFWTMTPEELAKEKAGE